MRLLLAAALLILTACSTEAEPGGQSGASGWVVTNTPPYPVGELSREPVLRIGALEGSAALEFTRLVEVSLLEDGGLVVVDRGPNEVRWFDPNGALRAQAGGEGEGPGEFVSPVSATLVGGDTLVVYDGRTRRLTAFDPSGALAGTRGLDVSSSFGLELGTDGGGGLSAVELRATFVMGRAEYNLARDSLVLMSPARSGTTVDTTATLPGPQSATWVAWDGDEAAATRQMELPLGEIALAAGTRDGFAVVEPGEATLSFYSWEGARYGVASQSDWEPIAASNAVRRQFVNRAIEELPAGGPPPGMVEREFDGLFSLLTADQTVPAYDRILVSQDGRSVWLRSYVLPADEGGATSWSVFGLDGTVEAKVSLPPGFQPTQVMGDRIAGIETDALGVEYASVYALTIR